MSRTFIIATLAAAALAGSALAGEANLFGNANVDANKLFGNNTNAQLLTSGGATTMSVQAPAENTLFATSTSSGAGASEIAKSALSGFGTSNGKAAFAAAAANSTLLTK